MNEGAGGEPDVKERARRGPVAVSRRSVWGRPLHPYAWWIWAIAAAICASRTRNPLGLFLIGAAVVSVAVQRRRSGSGVEAIRVFVRFGLFVIVARMLLTVLLGNGAGVNPLFSLPRVPLPDWMAGLEIGGPVYPEVLIAGFYEGLRLALILVCFGAVNALVSPYRLLRALPQVLHEAGVAVSIGLSVAPQLVLEATRVRRARQLRGRPGGFRGVRGTVMPVLEGALERAALNASSMDSRGYGRNCAITPGRKRAALVLGAVGLVGAAISSYGIFAPATPRYLGVGAAAVALLGIGGALWAGNTGSIRTTYRPDRWGAEESLVALAAVGAAMWFRLGANGAEIAPQTIPLAWPELGSASLVAAVLLISPLVTTRPTVVESSVPNTFPAGAVA